MPLDFPSSPTNGQVYGNYYYNSARGAWNALLPAATPNFFTNATLNTSTLFDATATSSLISTTPLKVVGLSGQTANLQEWQSSTGIVYARISSSGNFSWSPNSASLLNSGNGSIIAVTSNAASVASIVRGAASQTANLQEWQDSGGNVVAAMNVSGSLASNFLRPTASASTSTPIVVKAAASQTADLQQWQSSTGAVLSDINSAGELQVPRIGVGSVMPGTTHLYVTAAAAANIPVVIQGAASQTGDLQRWVNSSGTVLADVDSLGNIQAPKIGIGGSVPPTSPSSTTLELTGRAKILSNGSESAGIWLTGSNNVDSAFFGQFSPTTTDPIGIYHNGAWRFSVSSVGVVTMPNQPAFYAQGSGTQVISGTQSNVVIPMTIATENVGNHFNTSTYRFTAPVAGKYLFWTQSVTTDATSTGPEINILKNGTVLSNLAISYNSAFYNTFGAPIITTLAANDYVQMAVTNNNATTFTVERGRSRFAGYLIG